MNDLEYQLINEAHFNYGNTLFAMRGSVLAIEREIAKGNIPADSLEFKNVVRGYTILDLNYQCIDTSRYDKEHGGLIMREIKEQRLPELRQLIEDFKRALECSDKEELQEKLQYLKRSVCDLSSLGSRFCCLPKYQQYRKKHRERSG